MTKIVECVPNISDGRNPEVYNTVAKACEKASGVKLLDIDPGVATNRTVITIAGPPESIVDGAFELIKAAKEMIDMRGHSGEHPRMGAADVCPFVPVSGVTMDDCVELAKQLGRRVGDELGLWVYLYEFAASKPEWRNLANARQGEYEGLADRVGKPEWKPDFGPEKLDPKFGAVAVGARKFLVAYNINLNSTNRKMANDIAFNIREKGRSQRESYPDGEIIRHPDGTPVQVPGIFDNCKAGAWIIPEYNRAQITMNLTDIDVTPPHLVFDEVEKQAYERGMRVTGSEVVGLIPLKPVLEAGRHYLKKQGLSTAVSEAELARTAVLSMGLEDVSPFNPDDKIVEYKFKRKDRLVDMKVFAFMDTLASDAPAPGGGSTAALCGALAASLVSMVSNLTHGKNEYKEVWDEIEAAGVKGQEFKDWYLAAIDRDTEAFNAVMDSMRLPKSTDEQKTVRSKAMQDANKHASIVPLEMLEKTLEVVTLLKITAEKGNPNSVSDAGVGAHCLSACAEGAALNVRINMSAIKDKAFTQDCLQRVDKALAELKPLIREVIEIVNSKL
ncbi:glutamate formimidoyltransferase [bacterium]|nr:glutamate formimidoyltransferase [bacterium]